MAVARCEKHGAPKGTKRTYHPQPVKPIGYPTTAAICGRKGCEAPALVWLDNDDKQRYDGGARIMRIPNFAVQIGVQ